MSRSDRTLDAALAKLAERASFERVVSLYSRRYRLPPAEVADAVQTAFYKTLKTYAGKTVNAPEALLHQVIRNELITVLRRSGVVQMVELDEDFLALGSGNASRRTTDGDDDGGGLARDEPDHTDDDGRDGAETDDGSGGGRRHAGGGRPTGHGAANHLEDMMVETIDARELVRALLKEFDDKYRHVVVLLLAEWEPNELREKFGQNAYRMRAWARVKVCRILARFAAAGNDQAERLHARGGCHRILQSIQGAGAAAPA
jgi:DNA-directed RNA polymerase specialized sigma24 family protein